MQASFLANYVYNGGTLEETNNAQDYVYLIKAGVKVYEYQAKENLGRLHAKGMVCDDTFASIGSCNMDAMALRHNFEQNIISRDAEFSSRVRKRIFEDAFNDSTRMQLPSSWWGRFKVKVGGIITEAFDRFD